MYGKIACQFKGQLPLITVTTDSLLQGKPQLGVESAQISARSDSPTMHRILNSSYPHGSIKSRLTLQKRVYSHCNQRQLVILKRSIFGDFTLKLFLICSCFFKRFELKKKRGNINKALETETSHTIHNTCIVSVWQHLVANYLLCLSKGLLLILVSDFSSFCPLSSLYL